MNQDMRFHNFTEPGEVVKFPEKKVTGSCKMRVGLPRKYSVNIFMALKNALLSEMGIGSPSEDHDWINSGVSSSCFEVSASEES